MTAPSDTDLPDLDETVRARLNRETARLQWHELLPHFASGSVVAVDPTLDLIDVAVKISQDDTATISNWMTHGLLGKIDDQHAARWVESDPVLWTVIVKPWILVQLDQRRKAPLRHDA